MTTAIIKVCIPCAMKQYQQQGQSKTCIKSFLCILTSRTKEHWNMEKCLLAWIKSRSKFTFDRLSNFFHLNNPTVTVVLLLSSIFSQVSGVDWVECRWGEELCIRSCNMGITKANTRCKKIYVLLQQSVVFVWKKFLQCFQQWIVNTELPTRWYFTFSTHRKLLFSVHLMCLLEKTWSEKRESLFFCLNESEEKIYIHIVVLWCMKIRGNYLTFDVLATFSMWKRSILTSALAPIYHAL